MVSVVLEKPCTKCRETQLLECFPKQPAGKYGRMSICKKCVLARQKARRLANPSPWFARALEQHQLTE